MRDVGALRDCTLRIMRTLSPMRSRSTSAQSPSRSSTPRSSNAQPALLGHAAHEIRIIGGLWKRSKLKVLDKPGLRPTPDRVRETLFNWLGQDLTGWQCVDAFAGTGVLGFEAASRGAQQVLMMEQDAELVTQLTDSKIRLKATAVQVQRGDAVQGLQRAAAGSLDLVFLDPPFESELFAPALQAAAQAVAPGGWVYLEAPVLWADEQLLTCYLTVERHLKAGAVHAHLLKKRT
jgi:16S rRNA (guanine(966)-N(2))-methyltransferase RsmD